MKISNLEKEFIPEKHKNFYIDKITNKIYLGEVIGAAQFDFLKEEGITHVISLIGPNPQSPEYNNETGIKRLAINIDDMFYENIIRYFIPCIKFIEQSEKTFVHCLMGVSRSSTIVIAYLMWMTHAPYNEVLEYVIRKRECVCPNEGFVKQLKLFGEVLYKKNWDLDKITEEDLMWECK